MFRTGIGGQQLGQLHTARHQAARAESAGLQQTAARDSPGVDRLHLGRPDHRSILNLVAQTFGQHGTRIGRL
jgi:hypothetical protein